MNLRQLIATCGVIVLLSVSGFSAGRTDVADAAMHGDKAGLRDSLLNTRM